MRCLHCGKELALFKRLTKGEFCSNEHRQAYQREYSQMALSRLLQAKPPVEKEQPEESQTADETRPSSNRSSRLLTGSVLGLDRALPAPASERASPSRPGSAKRLPAPENTRSTREASINKTGTNAVSGDAGSNPRLPLNSASSSYSNASYSAGNEDRGSDMSLAHDLVSKGDERGSVRGAGNTEPELSIFRDPLEKSAKKSAQRPQDSASRGESTAAPPAKTPAAGSVHAPAPLAGIVPELPKVANVERKPVKIAPEPAFTSPAFASREDTSSEGDPAAAQSGSLQYPGPTYPVLIYPAPTYNAGPQAGVLPLAGSVSMVHDHLTGRIPVEGPYLTPLLLEPGLADFPCPARVIHLDISLEIAWKPEPFSRALTIPIQPRLQVPEGEVWRNRECQVGGLPVVAGDLARLRLPTAEVDDAESRRYRKTQAGIRLSSQAGVPEGRETRADETVAAGGLSNSSAHSSAQSSAYPAAHDGSGRNLHPPGSGRSAFGSTLYRAGSANSYEEAGSPSSPGVAGASKEASDSPQVSTPLSAPLSGSLSGSPRAIQIAWPAAGPRWRVSDRRMGFGDRRQQPRRVPLELREASKDLAKADTAADTAANTANEDAAKSGVRDSAGRSEPREKTAIPVASRDASLDQIPGFPKPVPQVGAERPEPTKSESSAVLKNPAGSPRGGGAIPALAEAVAGLNGGAEGGGSNLYAAPAFTQIDFDKARPGSVLAKIKSLLGPVPIILLLLQSGPSASTPPPNTLRADLTNVKFTTAVLAQPQSSMLGDRKIGE